MPNFYLVLDLRDESLDCSSVIFMGELYPDLSFYGELKRSNSMLLRTCLLIISGSWRPCAILLSSILLLPSLMSVICFLKALSIKRALVFNCLSNSAIWCLLLSWFRLLIIFSFRICKTSIRAISRHILSLYVLFFLAFYSHGFNFYFLDCPSSFVVSTILSPSKLTGLTYVASSNA